MKAVIEYLQAMLEQGQAVVMATIIASKGSTPCGTGGKMVVSPHGFTGTVGGGVVEARTVQAAQQLLAAPDIPGQDCARLLDFDLNSPAESFCGGSLHILLEYLSASPKNIVFFSRVLTALRSQGAYLLTCLEADAQGHIPSQRVLLCGSELTGAVASEICAALPQLSSSLFPSGHLSPSASPASLVLGGHLFFGEPYAHAARMILVGGGHVAMASAKIAALAGFELIVIDDRPNFVTSDRFPDAMQRLVVPDFVDCLASQPAPDENTFLVIVTRGHAYDGVALAQALRTDAGYIGMIGSIRKRNTLYAQLQVQGFDDAALARVHCPIGLGIHAETPAEIAVSIVAECIAHRRRIE